MANDVVEFSVGVIDLAKVAGDKLNIGDLQRVDSGLPFGDLFRLQIHAHKLGIGHLDSHRDQIAAAGAA